MIQTVLTQNKRYGILLILFFLLSGTFISCESQSSKTEKELTESECLKDSKRICGKGFSFALLGDTLSKAQLAQAGATAILDSSYDSPEFYWVAKVLNFPSGKIWIESEFMSKNDAPKDPLNATIGRIRVQTPDFLTSDNIKIGSSISDLRKLYADSLFMVMPITGFGKLQVNLPNISRYNYIVSEKFYNPDVPEEDMYSIKAIDPAAKIEAIVILQGAESSPKDSVDLDM